MKKFCISHLSLLSGILCLLFTIYLQPYKTFGAAQINSSQYADQLPATEKTYYLLSYNDDTITKIS